MNNYTIIGIDFGTSTTVLKVKNYYDGMKSNDCQSLMIGGSSVVPTLVFERSADGRLFFGQEAEAECGTGCEGVMHRNFKMDLLNPEKKENAERLIKEFMKYLYRQFSLQKAQLSVCDTVKTFISYPAKWTPEIIAFMKQCVIDAGFGTTDNVFGETEPTAAIYATFTNHENVLKEQRLVSQNVPINVMMLDMGAGTSDVTIFRFMADNNNKFHIGVDGKIISHPAVDNAYLCGGREVDRMLCDYNLDYLKQLFPGGTVHEGLKKKNESGVKEWKEVHVSPRLQENQSASLPGELMTLISMLRSFSPGMQSVPYPNLDRNAFEMATKEHWTQLHTLMTDAIAKAGEVISEIKGPEDIDLLIVTGGHSQWYCVQEMCLGHSVAGLPPINFKKIIDNPERLLSEGRPQETVANGLVFRDLSFDISHTASNNLWIQISLDDKYWSENFQPVKMFDTLPLTKTIEWQQEIKAGSFCLDTVKINCMCNYGATMASALQITRSVEVPLNNLFTIAVKTILLPFFLKDDEGYIITVQLVVNINEDGGGFIVGMMSADGGDRTFQIDL